MGQQTEGTNRAFLWVLVAIGAAAVAVGLLGAPLGSVLFVGLVLVCPLMMVGMHGAGRQTYLRRGTREDRAQVVSESETYKADIGKDEG